ncbi:glycerol-3-phosphate dehydrogenase/oxidase [Nocardia sp. NBC_00508]|uniref:glycerol-3-phosphate dehydrogenase/oxidase n=1 Tax=Nocardia sp. NBC_00508 TaxID=2975992 RepID=UPI002E81B3A8|nr:glycerol-3-phosphate dehydrogenase/oxidase [Nocardia sp. NBC_00508]WUD66022.1 glycerol-3-phosphate dehydrogenase/oxidase [Nocardia sp. NBC_00508]
MIRLPERKARSETRSAIRRTPLTLDRREQIERLASSSVDVLVVGGGVTGCYTALDAVTRGLTVALVERDDFASGTSSKSSKMVHGGLRYIEQGNLPLVRRSLVERQRFRRNAPHLVQRLPFVFPVLAKDGVFDARIATAFEGLLWTYDLAGGWRIGRLHQRLSVPEVLARAPRLRADRLEGGLLYYDSRTDDARLTLTIARTAAHFGATVLNGANCRGLLRDGCRVRGATIEVDGRDIDVQAGVVINATGVWSDTLDTLSDPGHRPRIRPAKGVHIVVPWTRLPVDGTVTVPVPGRARRATCTRWGDVVVVGTTDTDYDGSLDEVLCTGEEMRYLLDGANTAFDAGLTPSDVIGSIAGLRPLVGDTEGATLDMSRDHQISTDARGLVTVTGGKLTTSRHMGELVVDEALKVLGRRARCRTVRLPLLGGAGYDAEATSATGGLGAHLGERYGTEARFVAGLFTEDPSLAEPIIEGSAHLRAEIVYAARCELARTVDDVLSRRTRMRLFARDLSVQAAPEVGRLLQQELGLSDKEVARQIDDYAAGIDREKTVLMKGLS